MVYDGHMTEPDEDLTADEIAERDWESRQPGADIDPERYAE